MNIQISPKDLGRPFSPAIRPVVDWRDLQRRYHASAMAAEDGREIGRLRLMALDAWEKRNPFPHEIAQAQQACAEELWRRGRERALRASAKIARRAKAMEDQFNALTTEIAATRPATLADLNVKAGIARFAFRFSINDGRSADTVILASLLDDIAALAAGRPKCLEVHAAN